MTRARRWRCEWTVSHLKTGQLKDLFFVFSTLSHPVATHVRRVSWLFSVNQRKGSVDSIEVDCEWLKMRMMRNVSSSKTITIIFIFYMAKTETERGLGDVIFFSLLVKSYLNANERMSMFCGILSFMTCFFPRLPGLASALLRAHIWFVHGFIRVSSGSNFIV